MTAQAVGQYILRKNGNEIYSGPDYSIVSKLIPRWRMDHKGDRYDLTCLVQEGDLARISHIADASRACNDDESFTPYDPQHSGDVRISMVDLGRLLLESERLTSK